MQGHSRPRLNVAELEPSGRRVRVSVEELSHGSAVLGEVGAVAAAVPLLVVVDNVVGGGREELADTLVLEDLVEDPDLVDGRLGALVADAREGSEGEEAELDLPDEGLVEHEERETGPGHHRAGPAVVRTAEVRVDLVQVVRSAHPPLPEVVLEDVVAVVELVGVALSLGGLEAICAMDLGPVVHIDVVETLGGAEPQVVVPGGGRLAERPRRQACQARGLLLGLVTSQLREQFSRSSWQTASFFPIYYNLSFK